MRIMYIGQDERIRVAKASGVKFLSGGFRNTDKRNEAEDGIDGAAIVAHVSRSKGGKRLVISVPDGFDMDEARIQLLEKGFLDLTSCKTINETLY